MLRHRLYISFLFLLSVAVTTTFPATVATKNSTTVTPLAGAALMTIHGVAAVWAEATKQTVTMAGAAAAAMTGVSSAGGGATGLIG